MDSFGCSIIGLHDSDNKTIDFKAMFLNPKFTTIGYTWIARVKDQYGDVDPTKSAYVNITSSGLLTYTEDLTAYDYISVVAQRYTEASTSRSSVEFVFRLSDIMG